MAAKTTAYANNILRLIFNGVGIPNLADNASSGPLTNLYLSLHTADPGLAGTQSSSEATYTGYARVQVPRTTGGFVVVGNKVTLNVEADFGEMTGGSTQTLRFWGIGTDSTGDGNLLYRGPVSPNIPVSIGTEPALKPETNVTEV